MKVICCIRIIIFYYEYRDVASWGLEKVVSVGDVASLRRQSFCLPFFLVRIYDINSSVFCWWFLTCRRCNNRQWLGKGGNVAMSNESILVYHYFVLQISTCSQWGARTGRLCWDVASLHKQSFCFPVLLVQIMYVRLVLNTCGKLQCNNCCWLFHHQAVLVH